MPHKCTNCGFIDPDDAPELDPVQELAGTFAEECARSGYVMTGQRLSEIDAAKILRVRKRYLAGQRINGNGPAFCSLPVGGSRYSYELTSLAEWQLSRTTGEEWD